MFTLARPLAVLTLLSAVLLPGTAVAGSRPAGAPAGEVVAEVHLRVGTGATLQASGRTYPAAPGTALLRSDELVVPPGELLVVQLRNGYLVRLDDDLRLLVGKIVLVDAPRTQEALGKQLDRLLTKDEQGRAERIAGVQARLAGAEGGLGAEGHGAGGGGSTAAPGAPPKGANVAAPRTAPAPAPAPAPEKPSPPQRGTARSDGRAAAEPEAPLGGSAAGQQRPSSNAAKPPMEQRPKDGLEETDSSAIAPAEAPAVVAPLPQEAKLRACLQRALRRLPVKLAVAPLRLRVAGGKIVRVGLGGGLVLPACANQLLLGAPLMDQEGHWLERALPLR